MESENVDIESIIEARRKAVEQSIEPISIDEFPQGGVGPLQPRILGFLKEIVEKR